MKGQKPHATVFTCSDSRVPPEIVLDQKLGEIYVVRTSGKVLNANTISGIEYAVQFLGTNLVVLLGHENCNASDESVQAAILEDSKIIRDAVATGNVKVTSAHYHLDTGTIDWK
jgi:carbonic anhydrase